MKVTVLLADAAQTDATSGKVHALGIGWTVTSALTAPMAVLVVVTFDEDEQADGTHDLALTLVDDQYEPVALGDEGEPLIVKSQMVLNRNSDHPAGLPSIVTFALNLGPGIPLKPGRLYRWQVSIDDRSPQEWAASFVTREEKTAGVMPPTS